MARLVNYQTSFADGQISSKLTGFVDTASYKSSVADLKNFVVIPQGAVSRRPGTRYVTTTRGNTQSRLIPFNFGQGQAYVLEFGAETLTGATTGATSDKLVYSGGGFSERKHSLVGATVTNTTDSTTATITAVDSDTVLSVSADIFTSGENFSIPHNYVGFFQGNAAVLSDSQPYALLTPYSTADIAGLSFTQSADVLYIAHPSYQPRQLIRQGATDWVFETFWPKDGPYDQINTVESALLSVSGTTATAVVLGKPFLDATDDFFNLNSHDLLDGMIVKFVSPAGTPPTVKIDQDSGTPGTSILASGISGGPTYYVVNATSTTFQITSTEKGQPFLIDAANDPVEVSKMIYPKGSALTMKFGSAGAGTSTLWTNTGSKTKDLIYTYTETSSAVAPSDGSSDLLFTDSDHGLVDDDIIQFRHASGSLPGGIVSSYNYYVKKLTDDTFNISLSPSSGPNTTINYDTSAGSNVSWYKNNKFYSCVATHTATANNAPGSVLGADVWEELKINEGLGFLYTDLDTLMRFNPLTGSAISWGYFQVDSILNGLGVTATAKEEIVAPTVNHEWRKSVWNDRDGWPRSIDIYQQRLCFGGNNAFPQTVWFSKTGDYDKFSPSEKIGMATGNVSASGARIVGEQIKDDNAISLTISSATVDLIDWMITGKKLTIGTSGGIFQMYGSETEITLTPFNFSVDNVTSYPSENNLLPLIIDQQVVYVQKNKRKMREIAFKVRIGDTNASDLTLRADDITIQNIEQIVYQDMPNNLIWCRMGDGKLTAMTYNRGLEMTAWSNHEIGGTDAEVESLTVIPTTTHDQLWMIVKRTVNSATVRYVEYMDRFYDAGYLTSDEAHFVDSGVYDTIGTVTGTFTSNGTFTASSDSGLKLTDTDHTLENNDIIRVVSSGTLPTNLAIDTNYYVVSQTSTTFKLATTQGGSAIAWGGSAGTGTHTWYDNKITDTSHGLITNDVVQVTSSGDPVDLPAGLVVSTNYWVEKLSVNSFQLKTVSNGTPVDITDTGTGTHTWTLKRKLTIPVTHLKGETLRILADSALQNDKTVDASTGNIVMDIAGTKTHAGLGYDSFLTTLDLAEGPTGILVGNRKKIHRLVIKMLDTMGVKFGPNTSTLDEIIFRFPTDELGEAIAFFSGFKTLTMGNMSYEDHHIVIGQDGPFPMSVLLLGFDYDSNDL